MRNSATHLRGRLRPPDGATWRRNIASLESYGAPTDWASLAATDPKLAACTATFQGEVGVDWTRPEARAVVAEALLRHDFGITYHAAPGHLVLRPEPGHTWPGPPR